MDIVIILTYFIVFFVVIYAELSQIWCCQNHTLFWVKNLPAKKIWKCKKKAFCKSDHELIFFPDGRGKDRASLISVGKGLLQPEVVKHLLNCLIY